MNYTLLFTCIIIGFAIAAPVGPVGLICIRKAFSHSRTAAWVAGFGAACADTLFGAIAGLGMGAARHFIEDYASILTLVGATFLVVLGIRTLNATGITLESEDQTPKASLIRDFLSTFLITLTNPATMFGVVGIFAAFGSAAQPKTMDEAWIVLLGVFLGSGLWWMILTEITTWARGKFKNAQLRLFNKVSGALLLLFGAVAFGGWVWTLIHT